MSIMESKREGTCNTCRGTISVGQLIEWDRSKGASHYKTEACEAKVASAEEKAAYTKVLVAEIKAWDGVGSFRPMGFGDWVHAQG